MMCSAKTMFKVALGLLLVIGVAYMALPEVRVWLIAISPTLLFLICPISMLLCMTMMNKSCNTQAGNAATATESLPKLEAKTN